jgi:hypothetical protein
VPIPCCLIVQIMMQRGDDDFLFLCLCCLILWCALLVTGGAITGDMAIRYREVLGIETEGGTDVRFYEASTNTFATASLAYAPGPRPTMPASIWTDGKDAIFVDAQNQLVYFFTALAFITLAAVVLLCIVRVKVAGCRPIAPEGGDEPCTCPLASCRPGCRECCIDDGGQMCCGCCINCNRYCRVLTWIWITFCVLLLVGGAVLGARYDQHVEGTCYGYAICDYTTGGFGQTSSTWCTFFTGPLIDSRSNDGSGGPMYTANLYPVFWSTPRSKGPETNNTTCWCDGGSVDFREPRASLAYFFIAWNVSLAVVLFCMRSFYLWTQDQCQCCRHGYCSDYSCTCTCTKLPPSNQVHSTTVVPDRSTTLVIVAATPIVSLQAVPLQTPKHVPGGLPGHANSDVAISDVSVQLDTRAELAPVVAAPGGPGVARAARRAHIHGAELNAPEVKVNAP